MQKNLTIEKWENQKSLTQKIEKIRWLEWEWNAQSSEGKKHAQVHVAFVRLYRHDVKLFSVRLIYFVVHAPILKDEEEQ